MDFHDLIRALTFRVRFLSLEQVAAGWMPEASPADPLRLLTPLVDEKLLRIHRILAHPILPMPHPVFTWSPGEASPDHEAVSKTLQERWTDIPCPHTVILATKKAAKQLGGVPGALPLLGHEAHDLHLAELYVRRRRDDAQAAERWFGEDVIKPSRRKQVLPDAVLLDGPHFSPSSLVVRVIEFGGAYDAKRVYRLQVDCAERSIPYELW